MTDPNDGHRDLQEQVDELNRRITANRSAIEELKERSEASEARADKSELRADRTEARSEAAHLRIDDLEGRVDVDREMIAELQAEGVLSREHAADMQEALRSSRTIGAALGVVMAARRVDEEMAFKILVRASQHSNRKLRVIAEEVVRDLDVSQL